MNEKITLQESINEFTNYMADNGKRVFVIDDDCKYANEIKLEVFIAKFVEICERAIDTKKKKGHDYGNTFESTYADYGLLSVISRYRDKLGRVENLLKVSGAQVKDESIKDTILDLGNYCFMTYALMECIEDYKKQLAANSVITNTDVEAALKPDYLDPALERFTKSNAKG